MPVENKPEIKPEECSAFCPVCGSDLVHFDNACMCKNKDCNWKCEKCEEYNDV